MKAIITYLTIILMLTTVTALYVEDENLLDAGHAIRIESVSMSPENLEPGQDGILKINFQNGAKLRVEDIRINLDLPENLKHHEDVDRIKISKLNSGESREVSFKIIASPSATEGIYEASLIFDYTNFFDAETVNFGQEKQDNFTLGLIIKSDPIILVGVEKTDLYQGNNLGEVSIKFVNNGLADIKFLTVELEKEDGFDIISNNREYIGDLDSDDFESIDFRIKTDKNKKEIMLPIKMTYKDALNNRYEERIELPLKIRTAKELGIKTNGTTYYVLALIILAIAGYYFYKKYKKSKVKKHHN